MIKDKILKNFQIREFLIMFLFSLSCTNSAWPAEVGTPKLNFTQELLKVVIPAVIGGSFALTSVAINYFTNIKHEKSVFEKSQLEKCFLAAYFLNKNLQDFLGALYDSQFDNSDKKLNEISELLSLNHSELLVTSKLWVSGIRDEVNELSDSYRRIVRKISSFTHKTPHEERNEENINELIKDDHLTFMKQYKTLIKKIEKMSNQYS
jgi:hypothetical protein